MQQNFGSCQKFYMRQTETVQYLKQPTSFFQTTIIVTVVQKRLKIVRVEIEIILLNTLTAMK